MPYFVTLYDHHECQKKTFNDDYNRQCPFLTSQYGSTDVLTIRGIKKIKINADIQN